MRKLFVLFLISFSLTGCIQYTLVPVGEVSLNGMKTTTGILWNKSPFKLGPNTTVWTADGESLNQVIFVHGVTDGNPIFKSNNKNLPLPKYKSSMLLHELEDLVVSSLTNMNGGQVRIESKNLRPVKFKQQDGVQFDLSYFSGNGLRIKGKVKATVANNKFFLIIYTATDLHYFDKYEQEIDSMFDSATIEML